MVNTSRRRTALELRCLGERDATVLVRNALQSEHHADGLATGIIKVSLHL